MKIFNPTAISSLALIFEKHQFLKGKHYILADSKSLEKLKSFLHFTKSRLPWRELPPFPHSKSPHSYSAFLKRISCLSWMKDESFSGLFLATAPALLKKTNPDFNIITLQKGDSFPYKKLKFYQSVEFISQPGEIRLGSFLIDIYSPVYKTPLRLELLEDEIQSIHLLDSEFKRRDKKLNQALISSLSEWNLEPSQCKALCDCLREKEKPLNKLLPKELYQSYSRGEAYFGFESLLNVLDVHCALNFVSPSDSIYLWEPEKLKEDFLKEQEKWEKENPFFKADHLFLDWTQLEEKEASQSHQSAYVSGFEPLSQNNNLSSQSSKKENPKFMSAIKTETQKEPLSSHFLTEGLKAFSFFEKTKELKKKLNTLPVSHLIFVGSQVQEMKKLLLKEEVIESLDDSFLKDKTLIFVDRVIKESFVHKGHAAYLRIEDFIKPKEKNSSAFDLFRKRARALEFSKLESGDLLVHIKKGVAEFVGLENLVFQGKNEDFIVLRYKGGDKLFVPAYKAREIKKYSKKPSSKLTESLLDSLGNPARWDRKKSKAKKHIQSLAIELIELYKLRKQKQRPAFKPAQKALEEFEKDFAWEKTRDQKKAIQEIMSDMDEKHIMDRLLVGDTGFGKTEVALTALLRALENHYQVCFVAPTTILSLQHFKNFKKRFQNTPYKLALLNRFVSEKKKKTLFEQLQNGQIDLLVATHAVFNSKLVFKNLGLLVLDEEHRFGVKQKEKLFRFRKSLDVLSLSATPIPRTLNMALTGIKDISVITQAPAQRKPVKIYLKSWEDRIEKEIQEACHKERARGGQVIYIYNRVKSLYDKAHQLTNLLPDFKIAITHGKTKNLDRIILDFLERKYDLLLSTNIVESGMDIPQANTLFIDRSHEMGLSQIYQLKGRVGRSSRQAYCYLLYPGEQRLNPLTKERLKLLKKYIDLGSSFQLALHDLENRGAGALFGSEQSGHIQQLGEEFYFEILNEQIKKQEEFFIEPEIQLPVTVGIPSSYISDPRLRLLYYKNLSESQEEEDRFAIQNELLEEFGTFPEELQNLFLFLNLREFCKKNLIKDFKADFDSIKFVFHEKCRILSESIISLLKNYNGNMLSEHSCLIKLSKKEDFFKELDKVLKILKQDV